jgi:hypothetical protein
MFRHFPGTIYGNADWNDQITTLVKDVLIINCNAWPESTSTVLEMLVAAAAKHGGNVNATARPRY